MMKLPTLVGTFAFTLSLWQMANGQNKDKIYIRPARPSAYAEWLEFHNGKALVQGEIEFPARRQIHLLTVERVADISLIGNDAAPVRRCVCRSTTSGVNIGNVIPIGNQLFRINGGDEYGIRISEVREPGFKPAAKLGDGFIAYLKSPFCIDDQDYLTISEIKASPDGNVFAGEIVRRVQPRTRNAPDRIDKLIEMGHGSVMDISNVRCRVINVVAPDEGLKLAGWVALEPLGRLGIKDGE